MPVKIFNHKGHKAHKEKTLCSLWPLWSSFGCGQSRITIYIEEEIKAMRVMKRMSVFLIAVFFYINTATAQETEEVKITAKAVKDTVRAGREAKFVFHMQPAEGFHVNVEPQIKLALLETKDFTPVAEKFTPGADAKTLTTEDGYKIFDPKYTQPVTFAVKVAKGLKPGKYPVKAKLTYFFCSDKDGFCSFKSREFVFNLVVIK